MQGEGDKLAEITLAEILRSQSNIETGYHLLFQQITIAGREGNIVQSESYPKQPGAYLCMFMYTLS